MARIDQVNALLKEKLAFIISNELNATNFLVTITYVDTSADLQNTRVGVSILPDNFAGTALDKLRHQTASFAGALKRQVRIRHIPKITWVIDATEKEASKIDDILREINEEEESFKQNG